MASGQKAQLQLSDYSEVESYTLHPAKLLLGILLIVCSGGFLALVLFYWKPNWWIYITHSKAPLSTCHCVVLEDPYKQKFVRYVQVAIRTAEGDLISTKSKRYNNIPISSESLHNLTTQDNFVIRQLRQMGSIRYFVDRKVKYFWNEQKKNFVMLEGLEYNSKCVDLQNANGVDAKKVRESMFVYGKNQIKISLTPIVVVIIKEAFTPFYIFQLFSVCLWIYEEYTTYAIVILVITTIALGIEVYLIRSNQRRIKSTVAEVDRDQLFALRPIEGSQELQKVEILTTELVPGDVMVIDKAGGIMCCDAVLLSGSCIVNESSLTGESHPVMKAAMNSGDSSEMFTSKEHAKHMLHAGTNILQAKSDSTNDVITAVVIRTGFYTLKGELVRAIMYPKPVDFKFFQDSIKFIGCLFLLAGVGMIYTFVIMIQRGDPANDVIVKALDLVTIVVPPALPFAMSTGLVFALWRLKKNAVFCISPPAINTSGSITCIVCDKTGTLTEDGIQLKLVRPVSAQSGTFEPPVDPMHLPHNSLITQCLATCHSILKLDKVLSGDPLDMTLFNAIDWTIEEFTENDKFYMKTKLPVMCKVFPNLSSTHDSSNELGIVKVIPFNPNRQRMGVIVQTLQSGDLQLFVKGSPEAVCAICRSDSVPADLETVLHSYARHGFRLLALASRSLDPNQPNLLKAKPDELEGNQQLSFVALIVTENKLKPETAPVIKELLDAKMKVVMATGDNLSTAISVARECGLVPQNDLIYIVNVNESDRSVQFSQAEEFKEKIIVDIREIINPSKSTSKLNQTYSPLSDSGIYVSVFYNDELLEEGIENKNEVNVRNSNEYHLAMSGSTWKQVQEYHPEMLPHIAVKGSVFARMAPAQKKQLIEALGEQEYSVLMCGDGANDCEALSAAHTGIALSDAEASLAAVFTSKQRDVTSILSVLKEGRCTLTTSFGMFKFIAAYSLIQFFSCIILYYIGSNLTDWEFLYQDLFIITPICLTFGFSSAFPRLHHIPPHFRLLSLRTLISVVVHFVFNASTMIIAYCVTVSQPWLIPFSGGDSSQCLENTAVFFVSAFQYIFCAISYSKGPPYRRAIYTNIPFVINIVVILVLTAVLVLEPGPAVNAAFEIEPLPSAKYKLFLVGLVILNALLILNLDVCEYAVDFVLSCTWCCRLCAPPKAKYEDVKESLVGAQLPVLQLQTAAHRPNFNPQMKGTDNVAFESSDF